MKTLKHLLVGLGVLLGCTAVAQPPQPTSFYDLTARTLRGEELHFSALRGKRVLIVNVASKCGFTKQYEALQALFAQHGGEKFTIIGFPSNDFRGQEPGSSEEIAAFCRVNYGVTFQMMDKIHVVGDSLSPVYRWLTNKSENGAMDSKVKWNFQKYMVDEGGRLVGLAYSLEKPDSRRIVEWVRTGKMED